LITLAQLEEVALFADNLDKVRAQYPNLNDRRLIHETVRRMINVLVVDLCEQSSRNIANAGLASIEDIRQQSMLISFSPDMREKQTELKRFLRSNLYQHYRVNRMSAKAQRIVRELFDIFMQDPKLMPDDYHERGGHDLNEKDQARAVADYIAGMTDRYAIREYQRLFTVSDREF
jgi:dGTPase